MKNIEPLTTKDIGALNLLLKAASLPVVNPDDSTTHFIKAVDDTGTLIGAIGLEVYGEFGLMRSLVVGEAHRNQGIAHLLVGQIMRNAKALNLKRLVLLTTTADQFFDTLFFERIHRDTIPEEIKLSKEFSSICPVSAVIMQNEI
ncbi:MAG: arsenic resistance N-acetyltransferase ArsN2 [Bacteroidota bacterium]|nr:arsenic resistance N-acetyltransferase ArsN2 [Bacteroidota bacterium]